jgi:hypothetical protein
MIESEPGVWYAPGMPVYEFLAAIEDAEWWVNSQQIVWDCGKGVREGAD